jgi:predicted  nucleic acid-binding Zn-ribbon protein
VSDTPRTDVEEYESQDEPITKLGSVDAEFARTLERELYAANQRIKRLEEDLMDAKNKHAALVADVALYEDRGERIKRLEDIISRASSRFFRDGSDIQVANGMLTILEEVRLT